MDHLQVFRYQAEPYPRIPLLSEKIVYDGLPLSEYADRCGFDIDRLYQRDFTQHRRDQTASFLQNWLFFGTIQGILGSQAPIDINQFIEQDEHGLRLCTKTLEACITAWGAEIEALAEESPEKCRAALYNAGMVQNTLNKIYHNLTNATDNPLSPEATLVLGVLGCTFDHAFKWFWDLGKGRTWGLHNVAAARMAAAGWCPRDIAVSREFFSELPMFCASYMERRSAPFDHWHCSAELCLLNQIDETTYVTQHRTKGCQCQHVLPDQAEIRRIIDAGGFPVICVTSTTPAVSTTKNGSASSSAPAGGGRRLKVEVKAGSSSTSNYYTAVSHVWSDGLGNPNANSLPYCQIEFMYDRLNGMAWKEAYAFVSELADGKIQEYDEEWEQTKIIKPLGKGFKAVLGATIRNVITPIHQYRNNPVRFWMDTLCVPLDKPYRKRAISQMKEVYARAHMTIVLDSELQAFDARGCSDEELVTRMGLSGWMRRAWTFQEGALAADMMRFSFHDGPTALPLWKGEDFYGSFAYSNPKTAKVLASMEEKFANWIGVTEEIKIPQSRLYEMALARKTFSLGRIALEDSKLLFIGMKAAWVAVSAYYSIPRQQATRLIGVWNGLRIRATSHESDRFICYATSCASTGTEQKVLQGLLNLPHEQRMKSWVGMQPVVPSGLLFIAGERYDDPGYRWVPTKVHPVALDDDGFAVREPQSEAFVFKKPGFIIDRGLESEAKEAPAGTRLDKAFTIFDSETGLRYSVGFIDMPPADVACATGPTAIILKLRVGNRAPEYGLVKETGALLGNAVKVGARVYGDFVCRVEVGLIIDDDETSEPKQLQARLLEDEQEWIVR
ncbi:HET domain-containing protein [Podospora appendiculata]|uniref:HET domain-containing protein n=1 Tax=Podospora appendiculata TaxID=314037 RepID=A0AAE1CBW0_9PEZI|nr:HET domain-containing protein [Podospora appendiculata]